MNKYEITIHGAKFRAGAWQSKSATVKHVVRAATMAEAQARALRASPGRLDVRACKEIKPPVSYSRWDEIDMQEIADRRAEKVPWHIIAYEVGASENSLRAALSRWTKENSEATQ